MTLHRTAPPSAPVGVEALHARADEIERAIVTDGMGAMAVFTQMRQLLPSREAQQPAAVDGAMVERALNARLPNGDSVRQHITSVWDQTVMRAALTVAQQPAAVDGVKCPWDGGSPCVEPMPAGMVYPKKPAPRSGGYLDTSGVEWNAWDAGQMEAYARAAYSDGWEAGYRAALDQARGKGVQGA